MFSHNFFFKRQTGNVNINLFITCQLDSQEPTRKYFSKNSWLLPAACNVSAETDHLCLEGYVQARGPLLFRPA